MEINIVLMMYCKLECDFVVVVMCIEIRKKYLRDNICFNI